VGVVVIESTAARYSVEQIAVRSTCAEESLPSIVRRLTRGDMPTTVWWREDLSLSPPLQALLTVGRQFIYDSQEWHDVRRGFATAASILDQARVPDLVDLNWRRLAPMRRALVHGVRTTAGAVDGPPRVRVLHRRGYEASAWLMFGWLQSKLGLDAQPDVQDLEAEGPSSEALLQVRVTLGKGTEVAAVLSEGLVTVKKSPSPSACSQPIRPEAPADAIAAELRSLGRELGLSECIRAVHRSLNRTA
jgi:glucose-6-phosphate dehydrogenase assembly protein OpcA